MEVTASRETAWVGVDIGKTHHWVCALDDEGTTLLSVKIANDEAESGLIATVRGLADQLVWAVDIIGAPSALMLALLTQAGQTARYASGRVVAAMSSAYTGEGKTDAKDAYVIAETANSPRSDGYRSGHGPGPQSGGADRASHRSRCRPRPDDQPAPGPDDRRLSQLGEGLRLRIVQGCAGAADRLRQPASDPPHRPDSTAPTRRITAASSGKMPTTSQRRLISRWSRSRGLVDQILRQ